MAKDVDLTSQEWLDIVFDGKNKEYGAYQMRATSTARHNKAVIIVLIILALIFIGLILAVNGVFSKSEEETNVGIEQEQLSLYNPDDVIEEDEPEDIPEIPEEKIEMPKEEVANSIQNTAIDIVKDEEVVNEVKTQDELKEDNRQMGAIDVSDGVDDLTKKTVQEEVVIVEEKPAPKEDNIIYTTANVQQQPEFPGGVEAMYKWIGEHLQYPAAAAEEGAQGRVTVEFVVSKTGAIENVKVVRGRHPALDKEALRVVKAMPKWNPGRNNGQPVKVTYILPVQFKLNQ
ncbi:MAG: energy transducer TonB [Muribaculaceae bacterium]|nr:energy transducer TonB [Muribaculaceae bacterium]